MVSAWQNASAKGVEILAKRVAALDLLDGKQLGPYLSLVIVDDTLRYVRPLLSHSLCAYVFLSCEAFAHLSNKFATSMC